MRSLGAVIAASALLSSLGPAALLAAERTLARKPLPTITVAGRNVAWSTGTGSPGEVHVAVDRAPEQLFANAPSGEQAAPPLRPGHTYRFRLYCLVDDPVLLASTRFPPSGSGPATEVTGATCLPPASPRALNAVLRVLPFGLPPLLAAAIVLSVRSRLRLAS